MERQEILSKVSEMIEGKLGIAQELSDDLNLSNDLGFDSLDNIELIMYCEQEFGINISDDEAEKVLTVGDMLDFLERVV